MDTADRTPIWAIFGDLMAGLMGVFVLLFVITVGFQLELKQHLVDEIAKRKTAEEARMTAEAERQLEEEKRLALEEVLSGPLLSGSITLRDGRIGISGSVLFALNSSELQTEGLILLQTLVKPLIHYLQQKMNY